SEPCRGVCGSRCDKIGGVRYTYDRRRKDELALAFVTAKEEGAVLDHRAANHATKVIVPEFVLRSFEEVTRVEVVIPQKVVCAAVEIVCSTLENYIDGRA